jgi:hypothetical protein
MIPELRYKQAFVLKSSKLREIGNQLWEIFQHWLRGARPSAVIKEKQEDLSLLGMVLRTAYI